jgi:hypothetical protein
MTEEQLFAINCMLNGLFASPQQATSVETTRTELISWTLTYLVKRGDTVQMKTVFVPAREKP